MKKVLIAAAVLSLMFAVSAFAVDGDKPQSPPAPNFDQRKTDTLKMLDDRIAALQDMKKCVQSAPGNEEMKTCWEKRRAEMREHRGPGAPAGPGGPDRPGVPMDIPR